MKLSRISQLAFALIFASVLALGNVGAAYAHPTPPEDNQGGQEGCVSEARHNPSESHNNDCGNR